MTSVIRTKTPKIEMLTAGSPMVSSAANSSATGRPLRRPRAVPLCELVVFEAAAHLVGDRVGVPVGVRDVQMRDREGRHELQQTEDQPDVDVAEDLGGHEVVRV